MTEINPEKMLKDAKQMLKTTIDILNCVSKSDKISHEISDKVKRISCALEIDVEEIKRLKRKLKNE